MHLFGTKRHASRGAIPEPTSILKAKGSVAKRSAERAEPYINVGFVRWLRLCGADQDRGRIALANLLAKQIAPNHGEQHQPGHPGRYRNWYQDFDEIWPLLRHLLDGKWREQADNLSVPSTCISHPQFANRRIY